MCSFYKGFPCNFFFTWKSFVNFFRIFKLGIGFFSDFAKATPKFSKIAHIYLSWTITEPIFREIKEPFWITFTFTSLSLHFHFTSLRTGAVGLGRFRLVHSRWSTAGEKLFFSYFFFLYIFSFFVFFCFFIRIKHSTCKTRGV